MEADGEGAMLEAAAKKEVERMETVLKGLKILDQSALELYNLVLSYASDARYFLEKKDFLRAFEAAVISWAWVDAGLHLKAFSVDGSMKGQFTVE
jgi:hypothetical protein